MATRQREVFSTVKTEGGLLPADLLVRLVEEDKSLKGLAPTDYHLGKNERLNEAVTRSWTRLRGVWAGFDSERQSLPTEDPGTTLTRERWLLILFQELGYGRLNLTRAREVDGKAYAISHAWQSLPIHLVGCNVDLDRRSKGVAGASTSTPYGLLQEYLNRTDDALWAMVSNGLTLRLLRDNVSLTRQAYVEFDLQAMMAGEAFSDFKLLWLICHQSRVEAERPEEYWLERWSSESHEIGTRILNELRAGVQEAIERLGAGFLAHPKNRALRDRLSSGELDVREYYRQLLRLVYRLLFLFVAEDRELLPDPNAGHAAQQRFHEHYSTQRLRGLAEKRRGGAHCDQWQAFSVVQRLLVHQDGCPELALPALGSYLWSARAIPDLEGCELANAEFLEAIRRLAFTEKDRMLRRVDYRNLGSEELGSVYESLLELHPDLDVTSGHFRLISAGGHDRKTSGSYYTPSELVQCLLDTALDPVIEVRSRQAEREVRVAGADLDGIRQAKADAILNLKVCDPACGSGHFLIAAAHRLAAALASARTGEGEPSPADVRHALRDVVSRCLYGVDINEMAVELCKVSLWMEALEPGRPLSFLDNKILCGNSLLGTTPALRKKGIPDEAFAVLRGDDKAFTGTLKKLNKQERQGQVTLFSQLGEAQDALELPDGSAVDAIDDFSAEALRKKEEAYDSLLASDAYRHHKLVADAWCAAFLWPKHDGAPTAVTQHIFDLLRSQPQAVPRATREMVEELARRYSFFHWYLAFPSVFEQEHHPENEEQGWSGGFDVVIGNPPWERVKLQEKEWFASRVPAIAAAAKADERKRLIADLVREDPAIFEAYEFDLRKAEGESHVLRSSGMYPLCGVGDVNTYAVFAECASNLLSTSGRTGIILPTGIATDHSTKDFFASLAERGRLKNLFSFENEDRVFPAVHHAFKFCLLTSAGGDSRDDAVFVWFARRASQVHDPARRFTLTPDEIALLNPNSRTCPIFRSSRDAEINKKIYTRVPVLWIEGPPEENPWRLQFLRHFDMSNDSGLFRTREELLGQGGRLEGNRFRVDSQVYLPLYEAKMLHHFDHRFGTYEGQTEAQAAMGKLPETTEEQHADPDFTVIPRYWVQECEVVSRLQDRWDREWFLAFRDICRNTDQRTVIASILPRVAVGNKAPLLLVKAEPIQVQCLYANLCALVFDYTARQKLGGTTLNYFYLKQFPVLAPPVFDERLALTAGDWKSWISTRVIELQYTSRDMTPFAYDCGYDGPPFVWSEDRRFQLRCELDAAFFHLYGLNRDDTAYILDTFSIVRKKDEKFYGHYRTKDTILQTYDLLARSETVKGTTLLETSSPSGKS